MLWVNSEGRFVEAVSLTIDKSSVIGLEDIKSYKYERFRGENQLDFERLHARVYFEDEDCQEASRH